MLQTEHWGVVFSRKPDGQMAVRRFGGMGKARTFFVGAITGQAMLHVLYEQLMKPERLPGDAQLRGVVRHQPDHRRRRSAAARSR